MSIENLLNRLDAVKRTGQGRYIAKCPAHPDKSPSLAAAEKNGNIVFHCFAGCEPADVLAAIGLTFSDLYPERPTYAKGSRSAAFNPYDVLKCLVREAGIVTLAAAQVSSGHPLGSADTARVALAHERLSDAAKLIGVRHE
ncbi:CHC2 zinc finger domain-containing protein [Methylomicrobium sp. Wu6]|uniref:CHC2 zinc finger domain-containing protein n=1 Tax=Methylomicrobium sp. Wu6 TaxID=3107928 RepID=UPI002DD6AA61|nr:CHC2 zinc finger domain-containing protein [Methylomicrobium sp. Wu6]MEC4749075.1 CHC2 zinc finger domain-containing protein [Methylomicrobium sp. Wu6]